MIIQNKNEIIIFGCNLGFFINSFYAFLFLFVAYVFQNVSQADEEFKSLPEVGKCSLSNNKQ